VSHDLSVAIGDALRVVTIVEALFAGGMAIAVFALYFEGNIHIRRADPRVRGALTRHVMAIAISYFLYTVFACAEIQGYYGTEVTWRTPIGFIAANFGIYALWNMLSFQRSRLDRRDETIHLGGAPEDSP
jgi:hypothetical protein